MCIKANPGCATAADLKLKSKIEAKTHFANECNFGTEKSLHGLAAGKKLDDNRAQGCQMAYFKTKNPNLGRFWGDLQWKMLDYFMAFWSILQSFGIGISWLFGIFSPFWYVVSRKIWQPRQSPPFDLHRRSENMSPGFAAVVNVNQVLKYFSDEKNV
jgi:hypothetical protein